MSFEDAALEARERLAESLTLLNYLAEVSASPLTAATKIEKAMRGLWLVSIYGAFERSVNAIVENAINEISSHYSPSIDCSPPIHAIFHYRKLQALKDCGYNSVFDKASEMLITVFGREPIEQKENPLSEMLQNVGANTLVLVSRFFGAPQLEIPKANSGRLNMLRERRNAVAHGRESSAEVGERYTLSELRKIYDIVDLEVARFHLHLQGYCENKKYLRAAA